MSKYIGQPHIIKKINKKVILEIVKEHGPISKPDISKMTKLSLPTVNKIIKDLAEKNILLELGKGETQGGGRKPSMYEINPSYDPIISLFFSDGNIRAVLANGVGKKIVDKNYNLPEASVEDIYKIIEDLLVLDRNNIKAIGIGIPGVVNNEGLVTKIPLFPSLEGVNLKELLKNRFEKKVFIENEVNVTGYGIYKENYSIDYNNFLYVYFGEKGVSSAIILNGNLYKGVNSFSGEIGFMLTRENIEQNLSNKKFGMLENEFGDILKNTKLNHNKENIKRLTDIITFTLTNLITFFDPDVIVVENDFVDLSIVKENIKNFLELKKYPLIVSQNNKNAGINGVIKLCLSEMYSSYSLIKGNK